MFSILYSILILCIKIRKTKGEYRKKVQFGLMGMAIPLVTVMVYVFQFGPKNIDIMPFFVSAHGVYSFLVCFDMTYLH